MHTYRALESLTIFQGNGPIKISKEDDFWFRIQRLRIGHGSCDPDIFVVGEVSRRGVAERTGGL